MKFTDEQRTAVLDALGPLDRWSHDCHAASLHLVRARVLDHARVARGATRGVGGQHSWVAIGDPYRPVGIVDPTLWSYDEGVTGVVFETHPGRMETGWTPKGKGSIWAYGCPPSGGGEEIVPEGLSGRAEQFLDMCRRTADGPLDRRFWMGLLEGPMEGWPAGEVLEAAADDPRLAAFIPIDVLGMLTDRNPGGLYLPEEEVAR